MTFCGLFCRSSNFLAMSSRMNRPQSGQRTRPARTDCPQSGHGSSISALASDVSPASLPAFSSSKTWPQSGHWNVSARISESQPGQDRMETDINAVKPTSARSEFLLVATGSGFSTFTAIYTKNSARFAIKTLTQPCARGVAEMVHSRLQRSCFTIGDRTLPKLNVRHRSF